ncbi:hypothetical protein R3X27_17735 [Tropicimonas sp. TH_r6]|uniref:hypothetical protein n=1 Tax=Tropicimonas sp. TH_r6 TaxID=3082085 RepID=UPI0029532B8A|nr:hypothetical protein [Tropicimonas sp. TH_r6]MDV7144523.1 hypothetical protein [Tropicimonas sp. TH_r6]
MPTKAELEAELTSLREELSAARERLTQTEEESGDAPGAAERPLDWAVSQLEGSEVDRLLKEFLAELEDVQANKPLLSLFGAFLLGYLLGRGGRV